MRVAGVIEIAKVSFTENKPQGSAAKEARTCNFPIHAARVLHVITVDVAAVTAVATVAIDLAATVFLRLAYITQETSQKIANSTEDITQKKHRNSRDERSFPVAEYVQQNCGHA